MASTRGTSGLTSVGLALTLIAVNAGVISASGGFGLLLSFAGVLTGASLIFVGVGVADDPAAPIGRPGLLAAGVRALVHRLRRNRNLALVGLLLASSAATATTAAAVAAEESQAATLLCFSAFALLLLGLSLLNIGVLLLLGEQQL